MPGTDDLSFGNYLDLIPVEADRRLLEEAGKAALAGALRLAYVGVWVGCSESLKRRFRELAPMDHEAAKVKGQIERLEADRKSIDAYVLGQAGDYGLIGSTDQTRLEHIYQMRCVYGHPYEIAPSPEDLVSAASTVTDLVLSRPLKLRHGYIKRQIELLTSRATFLDNTSEAVGAYARTVFARVDDALHHYLMENLWAEIEPSVFDPTVSLYSRRVIWFSRAYLGMEAGALLDDWNVVDVLTKLPHAGSLVLADSGLFSVVAEHAQDIIVGNLLEFAAAHPQTLGLLERLVHNGVATERQEERFREAVQAAGLDTLAAAGVAMTAWADRIVADLKSYNWSAQNAAADTFSSAAPGRVQGLDEGRQCELGRNILQAADGSAWSAQRLLQRLSDTADEWPDALIRGVVLECFANEQGQIRFKPKCSDTALAALRKLTPRKRTRVLEAVAGVLEAGALKKPEWVHDTPRQKMLEALDSLMAAEPALASEVQVVRNLVAALEIPDYE